MKSWPDLPLRLRLTLLYVGLLGVLLLIFSSAFYLDTERFLVESTAARLRAQAYPVIDRLPVSVSKIPPSFFSYPRERPARSAEGDLDNVAILLAQSLTWRDTAALILDRDGQVIASGRPWDEDLLVPPPEPAYYTRALSGEEGISYVTTIDGQRMLVLLIPVRYHPRGSGIVGVAQLSTSLAPIEMLLLRQRLLLVLGSGLALIIATIGGLWLTGSALTPLRRMINTSRRIAAGDLSQRVNLPRRRDEVGQLATAFDEMVARLEDIFAAQRRFVADAAHELRTPLTALAGSLEVLLRGSQDDPATVARLLRAMYREVTRLNRLSEQLLDLTRLNARAPLHRRTVDLSAFMSEFVQHARLLARDRQVAYISGPPVSLSVDPDALKQVLFNLVDNAVQHTAVGGTVRLGWQTGNGVVAIEVADDGEGIAAEDLPHIFEPFYRGDRSRSRRQGGTGLGLTLTYALVEAHGGEIGVSSQPGQGTRFTVRLPLEQSDRG